MLFVFTHSTLQHVARAEPTACVRGKRLVHRDDAMRCEQEHCTLAVLARRNAGLGLAAGGRGTNYYHPLLGRLAFFYL